jgi:hypothetical protein
LRSVWSGWFPLLCPLEKWAVQPWRPSKGLAQTTTDYKHPYQCCLSGVHGEFPVFKEPEGINKNRPKNIYIYIFPLSANQMGWRIAVECCGSHAG